MEIHLGYSRDRPWSHDLSGDYCVQISSVHVYTKITEKKAYVRSILCSMLSDYIIYSAYLFG